MKFKCKKLEEILQSLRYISCTVNCYHVQEHFLLIKINVN